MKNISEDDFFYNLAQKISEKGGRLYIVGGAVRDYYLGKEPHDIDYCVTGIDAKDMEEITHVSRVQGNAFPVWIVNGCEIAFARKERKVASGHKGFEMITDKSITIEQDLIRRDLTINSMAIDVLTKELIDPFGGLDDLKNKVLRHTSDAFIEDPLRVYRVARFASKFGYDVSKDTIEIMNKMKDELSTISAERVITEFRKALVEKYPEKFFEILKSAKVLDVHFKEIADLIGVEQPIEYHPEGDAFVHTLEVLQKVALATPNAKENPDEELTRFCALVHDLGKALTPREEWPHHYNHEERGLMPIHDLCKRIKAPNVFEKAGKLVSRIHMKAGKYNSLKPGSKVKMFDEIRTSRSISYRGVEIIARVDSKDETIDFAKKAFEVMKIGATKEWIEKCTTNGVLDYEKLRGIITQKRVEYLKELEAKKALPESEKSTITIKNISEINNSRKEK